MWRRTTRKPFGGSAVRPSRTTSTGRPASGGCTRTAAACVRILLIAGHKTDSERFYRDYVPRADAIYDEYLREIEDERRRAVARGGPKR